MQCEINPNVIFVFHDAFITEADTWNDLFDDTDSENVVMDTTQISRVGRCTNEHWTVL